MNDRAAPPTNVRRVVLAVVGLIVGFVAIVVGLNVLSGSDVPPEAPLVQTGTMPTATATTTSPTTAASAPATVTTVDPTGSTGDPAAR